MALIASRLMPLTAALILSACAAPHLPPPLTPPPGFVGAHVEDRALVMSDGALVYETPAATADVTTIGQHMAGHG